MSEFYGRENTEDFENYNHFFFDMIEATTLSSQCLESLILERKRPPKCLAFPSELQWVVDLENILPDFQAEESRLEALLGFIEGQK